MTIKILDPRVIAQIAAGEVVERPASVIKELVENSLDAGARQISIEIRGGGIDMMRVVDDGSGIPSAEAELAFARHATSKISRLEDLNAVTTLGFRGEALASIAAVAEIDLLTRAVAETTGTYLALKDGTIVSRSQQARSPGTTITVKHLFRKVPARLKFLKSAATESGHVANVVSQYALANPEVRFNLFLEGRPSLRTPGNGRLLDTIIEVYGTAIAKDMLEIAGDSFTGNTTGSPITVSGMVGSPSVTRTGRGYLSFFVNHRWVNSRLLAWAVEEAYQGLLMQGRHPVAVINISLPSADVDVNIHPAKTEVKFASEPAVFTALQKAVRQTLVRQMPVPKIEETAVAYKADASSPVKTALWSDEASEHPAGATSPVSLPAQLKALPILRVLGQFARNYIVAEGDDGVYIIDQHAAHERIRFEQIREQHSRKAVEVQGLLEPVTFEVSPAQAAELKLKYAELGEFGFTLEPFGERTYLVRTVPLLLYTKDWSAVLRETLDSVISGNKTDWVAQIIASMACHSAVRAGQVLGDDEMRELVRQLENVSLPRTCPHGRPTMLHLSLSQLGKEFGRT